MRLWSWPPSFSFIYSISAWLYKHTNIFQIYISTSNFSNFKLISAQTKVWWALIFSLFKREFLTQFPESCFFHTLPHLSKLHLIISQKKKKPEIVPGFFSPTPNRRWFSTGISNLWSRTVMNAAQQMCKWQHHITVSKGWQAAEMLSRWPCLRPSLTTWVGSPEPKWQKNRTNSHKLSSDLPAYAMEHVQTCTHTACVLRYIHIK